MPEGHYSKERIQKEIVDYLINRNDLYKLPFSGSLCNKLFLTSYLREYQMPVPDEVHIYEDTVISVPMIANAESVYVSGMSYYHYCTRDDSKLNTKNTENIDRSISLSFDYMRTKADKAICDFYEMYCRLEMCIESVVFYENEELSFYGNIPKNSKLIVYGAGSFGKALRKRLTDLGLNVVAWADIRGDGENIIRPDQINDYEYDYIVIGAMLGDVITNIRRSLIEIGISEDRIFSIHYL